MLADCWVRFRSPASNAITSAKCLTTKQTTRPNKCQVVALQLRSSLAEFVSRKGGFRAFLQMCSCERRCFSVCYASLFSFLLFLCHSFSLPLATRGPFHQRRCLSRVLLTSLPPGTQQSWPWDGLSKAEMGASIVLFFFVGFCSFATRPLSVTPW